MSVTSDARRKLEQAGASDTIIELLTSSESAAATILAAPPQIIAQIVANAPGQTASEYQQASQTFGFLSPTNVQTKVLPGQGPSLFGLQLPGFKFAEPGKGYVTNDSGALRYNNGVIADPAGGFVYYPPNDAAIPGSPAWLHAVSTKWSEEKIKEWRQRLNKFGYDVPTKGAVDQQLLAALSEFHKAKYLNFGTPIPFSSEAADAADEKIFDKAQAHGAVRAQYQRVFGDDPSDAELTEWTRFIMGTAKRLVNKKGLTPDSAATATQARFEEEFANDPQVQYFQDAEEDNTEQRDTMVRLGQVITSL